MATTTTFTLESFNLRKTGSRQSYLETCQVRYRVNYDFTIKCVRQNWVVLDGGYRTLRSEESRTFTKQFSSGSLIPKPNYGYAGLLSSPIDHALMDLIPDDIRQIRYDVSFHAALKTVDIINSSPQSHDTFTVKVDVKMIARRETHDIVQVPHMVPATDKSIKNLKHQLSKANGKECVICLEEILAGCKESSMPCSHTFHTGCIKKWLKTSHYCPLCRYKMPNINEDDEQDC